MKVGHEASSCLQLRVRSRVAVPIFGSNRIVPLIAALPQTSVLRFSETK